MPEKKTRKACLWNRRNDCHGMIEKLTEYIPDQWGKTLAGKAIESDYSIQYCNFCLLATMIERLEDLNETLEKIVKKITASTSPI